MSLFFLFNALPPSLTASVSPSNPINLHIHPTLLHTSPTHHTACGTSSAHACMHAVLWGRGNTSLSFFFCRSHLPKRKRKSKENFFCFSFGAETARCGRGWPMRCYPIHPPMHISVAGSGGCLPSPLLVTETRRSRCGPLPSHGQASGQSRTRTWELCLYIPGRVIAMVSYCRIILRCRWSESAV